MIKEFEFFHGAVFARIIHGKNTLINIENYPSPDNASYILNNKIGIYIKYSSKRMSPWRFSFLKEHQNKILEMKNRLEEVYIVFVCNDDGIACLNYKELKEVLDSQYEPVEWVSIARGPREKYEIKGHDGKLHFKIGNSDFPQKIFDEFKRKSTLSSFVTKFISKNKIISL